MRRVFLISFIFIFLAVSSFGQLNCTVVYAESSNSSGSWENIDSSEQYQAFIAYCKSRKVFINGSILDAATIITTKMYQDAVSTLGLDINSLQASLYKYVENNQTVKWGLGHLGINGFNAILGQILQNYNIQVDDENVDVTVESGKFYKDEYGSCFVYVLKSNISGTTASSWLNYSDLISESGTIYRFSNNDLVNLWEIYLGSNTPTYSISNKTYYFSTPSHNTGGYSYMDSYSPGVSSGNTILSYNGGSFMSEANLGIFYAPSSNAYFLGALRYNLASGSNFHKYRYVRITNVSDNSGVTDNTDVTITSPKVEPPLEPPSGDDITTILPDGTIEQPVPDPGGTLPDWSLPDSQITPIDPDNPSGGSNIDWNFQLPDLNIDWSINGLTEKFPFSIPFDIVRLVSVLSAEPEAPHIEGTVDLMIYQWQVDIDLSDFDTVASILRNMLFILFCIGLIVVTRSIIRG